MKLTKRQREVLTSLRDDDADLAYSTGGGWWVGDSQTSGRLAHWLISNCLVKADHVKDSMELYFINESGRRLLDGLPPYCNAEGLYFGTLSELIANQ